jgi:uncharacterized protein YjiS (DUF1127 family)
VANKHHAPGPTDLTPQDIDGPAPEISGERRRFAMRNAASFIASQYGSSEAGILPTVLRKARKTLEALKHRREVAALVDFDDHMLADIGLTRRDVREALDLPFSFDPGRELQARTARGYPRGWNV